MKKQLHDHYILERAKSIIRDYPRLTRYSYIRVDGIGSTPPTPPHWSQTTFSSRPVQR